MVAMFSIEWLGAGAKMRLLIGYLGKLKYR